MKVFNIFFCVALILVASTSAEEDDLGHTKCMAENNISDDEYNELWIEANSGSSDIDNRMKCYTHCILESSGHLDDNGKLDIAKMGQDREMTENDVEIAEDCRDRFENVEEKCDYSYQVSTCIAQAMSMKALLGGESSNNLH
ncbi:general odorant-binding protein 57c-like [Musca vetustissima]|uniref:general odorant-binding protein 57c-like n=1 Tax=Musca vetustissima TaxID=27455 RepID=UPI002AB63055|nr:general odorant-binding protein 57c-like [Musca vetustissima]